MAGMQDTVGKAISDEPFVVVGENQCVKLLQGRQQQTEELLFRFRRECIAALVVNAHDLLVASDDARLHGGYTMRIGEHATLGNLRLAQTRTQRAARFVILRLLTALFLRALRAAHNSEDLDARTESRKIGSDVARASQTIGLRDKIHHGNRRLR